MAQWTILVFSSYGVLHGQEIQVPTEEECCQDGRNWAQGGKNCANLKLISSSPTCRISKEQCCAAAVEDRLCENGIEMSKEQWVCERPFFQGEPWETQISKLCCDCCMLGLVTADRGSSCEFQGLLLGRKCLYIAQTCCDKNTTEEPKPAATAPVTEKPHEGLDPCGDSLCSQLCEGHGTCACLGGYQLEKDGVNCEDVNECLTHSHNCVLGQVCINTKGSFRCRRETSCGTGYELNDDNSCQDIDECALETHNCGPALLCTNAEGSFRCLPKAKCSGGFIQGALGSCVDVNECVAHTSPCPLGQTCINTWGSYSCRRSTLTCGRGYQLTQDGSRCKDVNECLTHSHNCVLGKVCINTEGSFRCQRETSCGTGYELNVDNTCQDIDECVLKTHNCGPALLCTNAEGSFRCLPKATCSGGFIQGAFGSCVDVNECVAHTSPCPLGQTCINTWGSYSCRRSTLTCGRGYYLTPDGSRCKDVDECRTGNVCVGHGCVNLVGTYRCECKTGFTFNSINKQCEDINECRYYPSRLCAHSCENTVGSYRCICTTGFKLSPDNENCYDVNECDANPCTQECANVYGSYQCYCRRGYQLSDIDGITCEDINECALTTGVCSYRCYNTPGSFYCTCPPTGYRLAYNGRTCRDIDECAERSHICSISQNCFNIQGGFRCVSITCPQNFRQVDMGSTRDASINGRCRKSCPFYDEGCNLDPVHFITYTSLSLPTFRDFSGTQDIAFLKTATATNHDPLPGATQVFFDILATDDRFSFDVVKRSQEGRVMGVIRQVKPIFGPRDIVLEVAMDYVKSGDVSHRNVVVINVFTSEFWF